MDPSQNTASVYQDDEITLKELIEKVVEFCKELWGKKWWIILITIPFIVYFGYKAKISETTYNAELTYTLNDGSGGGGAIAGILGTFGLGKAGKVNLDKIVELSKSRNIMHRVLFTIVALDTFGGQKDFIANHIINLHKLDKEWTNRENNFIDFSFKNDSIPSFDHQSLAVLKKLYIKVVGNKSNKEPIFTNGFNEDTGILTMAANTVNEQLSIIFVNLVYKALKEYYIAGATKGNQTTFEFVELKTDSIFSLLKVKEFQLSRFTDSHRNLTDPGLLTQKRLIETEILKLKTMYAEATKNRELADFSLTAGTPDITIIDEPLSPLDVTGESFLMALIKGALIGGLISAGFIIGRKIVLNAIN